MNVRKFDVPDVKLILPKCSSDARGYLSETRNDRQYRELVGNVGFGQDNRFVSTKKGRARGLHFQKSSSAQGKLVRVLRGSIFDVAVNSQWLTNT